MRLQRVLIAGVLLLATLAIAYIVSVGARPATAEVVSLDGLDRIGRRIGVVAGHDTAKVAQSFFVNARLVPFDNPEDAVVALLAGRLDGIVHDEHVLNVRARAYPNRLRMLDERLAQSPAVVLVSKRRPELQAALNRFIGNCKTAGIYDDMLVRWCQGDRFVPMPKIPEVRQAVGVLRVGTSGGEEPSTFRDDTGGLAGFDLEFVRRFAQMMRFDLRVECRPAERLREALAAGALDLVVDDVKAHAAMPGALFSDVYFDTDVKVLVRADGDPAHVLSPARLGWSRRLIRDPRLALFAAGALTTLAIVLLASLAGLVLTLVLHLLARRFSGVTFRAVLDVAMEAVRLMPPSGVLLALGCFLTGSLAGCLAAVLALSLRFAAHVAPTLFTDRRTAIRAVTERLVELVQWSSAVGVLGVCDLTGAVDLVCGRTPAAFGAIVSVLAAYVLAGWLVRRAGAWLERMYA